jgi:hypothetical protein
MPTGGFVIGATTYAFEIRAEEVGEEAGVEISEEPMLGAPATPVTYIDAAGQTPEHKTLLLYFPTPAAYRALVAVRGIQGTLTPGWEDDAVEAILTSISRVKRNWDGKTEARTTWVILE